MKLSHPRGFTLIELMVTIAIAGILLGLALPSLRTFIQNSRLTSAANDLLHSLQVARTEAVKRQNGNVVVCATANPTATDAAITCSYGAFNGWFVFNDANGNWQHDANEAVIQKHGLLDTSVTVHNDNDGAIGYAPSGFAALAGAKSPSSNVVLCDQRGNAVATGTDSTARALLIANTGRARVTKVKTEVATAITNTGGSCP